MGVAKRVQFRGGDSTSHQSFTGAEREVTVDITKNTLVVHDGITPGGVPLAKELETQNSLDLKVDKNEPITPNTNTKITYDSKGLILSGSNLEASDIPDLDASKITSGIIDSSRLPSFVDDVIEYPNLASFPVDGEAGKIYIALDTNKTYRWSGSTFIYITSGAVDSVNGYTGIITLNKSDIGLSNVDNTADASKNVLTATKLATARTIGGVSFDGSANINLPGVNTTGNQNTTGNSETATKLATARTITLSGDVSGSASFDGSANITITAVVADDSHVHTIANVDGLQTALDAKVAATSVQALHATDALRISGSTLSLYKGSGGYDSVTLPSSDAPTATGAIGTYAYLAYVTAAAIVAGTSYAGSSLRYSGISAAALGSSQGNVYIGASGTPSGTWRAMGSVPLNSTYEGATLFLRIA